MLKYAHLIPFYPLVQMIRVQARYGLISYKKWQLILIWFIKLVVLEPFRLFEAMVMVLLPEKKVKPIFILGYYRSGTTYLQELLSANKNHRTLTLFQSVLPEVSLCFGWLFVPIFSTITKFLRARNKYHNMDFDWRFPGEEDVAINAMMALHDYNRVYQFPSKYETISEHYLAFKYLGDSEKWLANYNYLIKKLAYCYNNKKLVLKSPPNMGRIQLLQKTFPEAKFVFIHRDPFECIVSAKRLWRLNQTFAFENYTEEDAEKILILQYQSFYKLFMAHHGDIICTTITFDNLIKDAPGTLEFLYNKLDLGEWEQAKHLVKSVELKRKISTVKSPQRIVPPFINQAIKVIRKELGYTENLTDPIT